MTTKSALESLGFKTLVSSKTARVAIDEALEKELAEIDERKMARLTRIMELWTAGHQLTAEQFNGNEGRAKRGDLNAMLQAFKTHKVRLFGVVMRIDALRTFLIVAIDPAKKQNKADPKVLKRSYERALEITQAAGELK
jgi:hypothetical protein